MNNKPTYNFDMIERDLESKLKYSYKNANLRFAGGAVYQAMRDAKELGLISKLYFKSIWDCDNDFDTVAYKVYDEKLTWEQINKLVYQRGFYILEDGVYKDV